MKDDKALIETWKMKEKSWEETKHLSGKKLLNYILKDTASFRRRKRLCSGRKNVIV